VSHLHLNDGTVEWLWHRSLPVLTIQYHSEASPGPQDNVYIFDRFLEMWGSEGRRRATRTTESSGLSVPHPDDRHATVAVAAILTGASFATAVPRGRTP
jgi:hypothetical protein